MSDSKDFLTLNDLYDALSDRKRSFNFDATKSGTPLLVHSLGNINYEESNSENGLTQVEFNAANTGSNLNRSFIDYDVMKDKLMPTFKNRPILGYIHEVDGEPCFYSHNMHIDSDSDEIIYDEFAVGIIPESNNATLEYNEEDDNYSLKITGYLFDEYTKAVEILNREKECAASVEIAVSKMSYNAKEKMLNIEDGYFAGITILGKAPDGTPVKPGMKNASVKLKDFEEASVNFFANIPDQDNLLNMLNELRDAIEKLNLSGKEVEKPMHDTNFDEENVIVEENANGSVIDDVNNDEIELECVEDVDSDADEGIEGTVDDESGNSDEASNFNEADNASDEQVFESRVFNNGHAVYELSHEDIRFALYTLLNSFEEEDNEWYFIECVYDDSFVYTNWFGDKIFGQKYAINNNDVTFEGDRYVLYRELLTQEEKDNLDNMRKNYSIIEQELNDFKEKELMAMREQIITEDAYACFADEQEFAEIRENISNYSPDDLRTACDLAFAKCVKRNGSFEKNNKDDDNSPKPSAIFAFGAFDHESDFLQGLLNKH